MEQYLSDLIIHFYCKSKAKPKSLSKLAQSVGAAHHIHDNISSLTTSLAENANTKNQIIIFEKCVTLSDHQVLNIIRNFPTIVLDGQMRENQNLSKKHAYWKANGFLLGGDLAAAPPSQIKMNLASIFPQARSIADATPWHAAVSYWDPIRDANRKLSVLLEKFLESTCPALPKHQDVITFAKYVQNRGKGRGTFKTIGFKFIVDATQVIVTAKLDWFNKSEQSLKVLFSGLSKTPYESAYIKISSPKTIEITGVWQLVNTENLTRTLMVAGLPGNKVDRRHLFETNENERAKKLNTV